MTKTKGNEMKKEIKKDGVYVDNKIMIKNAITGEMFDDDDMFQVEQVYAYALATGDKEEVDRIEDEFPGYFN